jgi:hypothetical protein
MNNFIIEIQEFWDELIYLLKKDWENLKKFYNEKKKLLLLILVSFISVKTVGILNIGSLYNKYCDKNMKGGGNNAPKQQAEKPPSGDSGDGGDGGDGGDSKKGGETPSTPQKTITQKLFSATKKTGKGTAREGKQFLHQLSSGIRSWSSGPILGNLGIVKDSIMGAFAIIGIILAIVGIISLPFLIFMILVYSIIKVMGKYLMLI